MTNCFVLQISHRFAVLSQDVMHIPIGIVETLINRNNIKIYVVGNWVKLRGTQTIKISRMSMKIVAANSNKSLQLPGTTDLAKIGIA